VTSAQQHQCAQLHMRLWGVECMEHACARTVKQHTLQASLLSLCVCLCIWIALCLGLQQRSFYWD
jgi:hypothetical protein